MTTHTQKDIQRTCDDIKEMLLAKNRSYGDSAIKPERIFSSGSSIEQLLVRIDDKLSRIKRVGLDGVTSEDTIRDLIGYLILLDIAMKRNGAHYEVTIDDSLDWYNNEFLPVWYTELL